MKQKKKHTWGSRHTCISNPFILVILHFLSLSLPMTVHYSTIKV